MYKCLNVAWLHPLARLFAGVNKPDVIKYISWIWVHMYMPNAFDIKFIGCTSQIERAGSPHYQMAFGPFGTVPITLQPSTSGSYNIKRVIGQEQILHKVEEVVAKETQAELKAGL